MVSSKMEHTTHLVTKSVSLPKKNRKGKNMTPYILTDEKKIIDKTVLHRIELTENCQWGKAGDKGGFIESTKNLTGDAWVGDNACVYGNARVTGNACVYECASVFGNAIILNNAQVFGCAKVYENARVAGDAYVYDHASIHDDARIMENVIIYGTAIVGGNASISGYIKFWEGSIFNFLS